MKKASFIKGAFVAAAASLALSAASVAQAGELKGNSLSGEGVTITYNNGAAQGTTAGQWTGTFDFDGAAGPIPAVNILFWCIDIFKGVSNPFSYPNYTAAIYQSAPLAFSAAQQQNLARLFANNFAPVMDAHHAAAFQLAIWDILFDTDANLSTTGAVGFGATGLGTTITLAQGYLDNLGGANPSLVAIQFTSADHQNFITPGLIPGLTCERCQIPEPSPLPLLVIGAAGMLFAMRRRIAASRT